MQKPRDISFETLWTIKASDVDSEFVDALNFPERIKLTRYPRAATRVYLIKDTPIFDPSPFPIDNNLYAEITRLFGERNIDVLVSAVGFGSRWYLISCLSIQLAVFFNDDTNCSLFRPVIDCFKLVDDDPTFVEERKTSW